MWTEKQLQTFKENDDFYVAPFRADMKTLGSLTYIWAVVVADNLYIRGGRGQESRWYQAAKAQKSGQIKSNGQVYDVNFEAISETGNEPLMQAIDQAYIDKFDRKDHTSTQIMTNKTPDGPRTATIKITPAK